MNQQDNDKATGLLKRGKSALVEKKGSAQLTFVHFLPLLVKAPLSGQ
jgi:hypothetical protein